MAMTQYSGDTEIITNIGTTPQERGLSTDEFKAKFDEGLKAFVTWFNDTHKTEFDAHLADDTAHGAGNKLDKAGGTMSGELNLADNLLTGAVLKDYAEECSSSTNVTGAVVINLAVANVHSWILSGAVTAITINNPPPNNKAYSFTLRVRQGATAYAITWPASVKWKDNTVPDLSTINYDYDIVLNTMNGGVSWQAGLAAKYPV